MRITCLRLQYFAFFLVWHSARQSFNSLILSIHRFSRFRAADGAAVLQVGDDLLVVGRSCHGSSVHQVAAESVVRTADGELELRDVALEGIEVSADGAVKLIHAEQSLASKRLHVVLVGIDGCRLVEVVLSERRRKEIVEERGLEDAALSHKDDMERKWKEVGEMKEK